MLHELNLMDWRQSQSYRRKRLLYGLWLLGGCLWIAAQVIFFCWWHQQQTFWQKSEQRLNAQLREQQKRLYAWQVRQQHAQQNQRKLADAEQWIAHSQLPPRLMSVLASAISGGIYLEAIHLADRQAVIQGLSRHPTAMSRFIQRLRQTPSIQQLDILSVTDQTPDWGSEFNTFQLRLEIAASTATDWSPETIEADAAIESVATKPVATRSSVERQGNHDAH
ncbi:PilN domain-containing protein [Vibrio ruber]|uniref:PilN domain-containing protein n=1 Tax=Vibrio ruber TaxID=184755 RepID=UPI0028934B09|nr:PilN domain-containing protein [Vibrio ruber]WNJ96385.1 PilN domain-containing protein [Vibrio ruber]